MKVLLTGASGQLGQALIRSKPPGVELFATSRRGGGGQLALDLADGEACRRAVRQHRPDWVLNAGAYTAVDRAESQPELAHAVNASAPAAFVEVLESTNGRLLQVSTDFIFSGQQGSPYLPSQLPDPLGVYGSSKAAGEAAALQLPGARVLRTGWVYGPVGDNFCCTMLRLHRDREQLGVVADQVGCPTSTATLAAACWRTIGIEAPRILHWSDAGVASWYDFAVAIGELGVQLGLLERAALVKPISTADYPTPALRPNYSLLDCTVTRAALGLPATHWRVQLESVLSSSELSGSLP